MVEAGQDFHEDTVEVFIVGEMLETELLGLLQDVLGQEVPLPSALSRGLKHQLLLSLGVPLRIVAQFILLFDLLSDPLLVSQQPTLHSGVVLVRRRFLGATLAALQCLVPTRI